MDVLSTQMIHFLAAVVTGFFIGILFDFYRAVVKVFSIRTRSFYDLIWWFLVTAGVFFIWLEINWGEVRLYFFVGQGLGLAVYLKKYSRNCFPRFVSAVLWQKKVLRNLIRIGYRILKWLKKIIGWPLVIFGWLLYWVMKPVRQTIFFVCKVLRALPRILKRMWKNKFIRK